MRIQRKGNWEEMCLNKDVTHVDFWSQVLLGHLHHTEWSSTHLRGRPGFLCIHWIQLVVKSGFNINAIRILSWATHQNG